MPPDVSVAPDGGAYGMLDGMLGSRVRDGITLPSLDDGLAAAGAGVLGGPPGRHAAIGRSWWTPLRIMLAVLMVTLFAGWSYKAPCQAPSADWGGQVQTQYTHLCYSDIRALYEGEGLSSGKVPYRDVVSVDADGTKHYVEYPVGIGLFMQAASVLTHALPADLANGVSFFQINAGLLSIVAIIGALAFYGLTRRRPWDAVMFAAAPTLALHAFTNWDVIAVAFGIVGVYAWARERPLLAGVLLGLGTATKMFPGLVLVAIAIVALGARDRAAWRATGIAWAAAVGTYVAVNIIPAAMWPSGWWYFFKFSQQRGAESNSLWFHAQAHFPTGSFWGFLGDTARNVDTLNKVVAALLIVGLAAIAGLAVYAPTRPRLAQIAFLVMFVFLITGKVWSPQYTLWLLPWVVLSRPRWGLFLVWQLSEIAVWAGVLGYLHDLSNPGHGVPLTAYTAIILVRDALLVAYAVLIVRDILRPEGDVVRQDHFGLDPLAGPFDSVADQDPEPVAASPALA
ncbi:MAG: hypothetical protein QOF57_2205 [Frankiaceae bacterium]|nr:hypothetical protein [Frankiaceae bacterium]